MQSGNFSKLKNLKEKALNVGAELFSNTIREEVNSLNNRTNVNRLNGVYNQYFASSHVQIDYLEVINSISEILKDKETINELYYSLHSIFVNKFNCSFSAIGILNSKSKCINLKLIDKIGSTYSSRVFLNEEESAIVKSCQSGEIIIEHGDAKFLNISHLNGVDVAIIPIKTSLATQGVLIVGDSSASSHVSFYSLISNYLALFIENKDLREKADKNVNTDSLTGLKNHRGFQEILTVELNKAQAADEKLSTIIFDINNISAINKELGHSKGDEIIKTVAQKIKQNIRTNDEAGRYGGDEIGLILPNTDANEAKYIAEYLTYTLSCNFVDDVGPIKVSVGIATYPDDSKDQEKLLILAEQAMFVSKSKGYENGNSTIVSAQDSDFWNDQALGAFAQILTKRHSQIGINFEEALVDKFQKEDINSQNHLLDVVTSLAGAIDAKDEYTKGHSTSVSRYAEALAKAINLPANEVERIKLGALLHDVGKIGIPENILKKPKQLDREEWLVMKEHPVIGAEKVLAPNESLHDLIPIVKYHHEHWDGSGYPYRLKGEEIPLAARIVAIADAFHALISDRPYRKAMSVEKACEILKIGSGIQWDKELVRSFIMIAPSLSTTV